MRGQGGGRVQARGQSDKAAFEGRYAGRDSREVPQVVLLDLNLPRVGGREVLRLIQLPDGREGELQE